MAGDSVRPRRKRHLLCGHIFLRRHFLILRPRRPFLTLLLLRRRRRARGGRHTPPSAAEKPSELEELSLKEECTVYYEMLVGEISKRYAHGLQQILQLQCEALVQNLGVSPLICGVVGSVWLRFLMVSRVLSDDFSREVLDRVKQRANFGGRKWTPSIDAYYNHLKNRSSTKEEPCYRKPLLQHGLSFLRKQLPLHSTLAVAFLCCHIARQPVLPNDIVKWALESKLPYISAYLKVKDLPGKASDIYPLTSRKLFRPTTVIGAWKLETMAATITGKIGLRLPPVNFYAIAYRYLEKLSLPVERILPLACRVYEWLLPVEMCLSENHLSLPTRVYVVAVLMMTLRIMYNIHGQGIWEANVSSYFSRYSMRRNANVDNSGEECDNSVNLDDLYHVQEAGTRDDVDSKSMHTQSTSHVQHIQDSAARTLELFHTLEVAHDKMDVEYDYSKDFVAYIKYCKDAIFARRKRSEVGGLMEKFCHVHGHMFSDDDQFQEDSRSYEACRKRSRRVCKEVHEGGVDLESCPLYVWKYMKEAYLNKLKSDMERNGFNYIPPKVKEVPENSYVQYSRKKKWGKIFYVAHADYYILLRTFAKAVEVDCRILHLGVLSLENRMQWIEKRISKSLVSLRDGAFEDMINDASRRGDSSSR